MNCSCPGQTKLCQYVIDIKLNGGKGYSSPMTTDEWNAFIEAAKGKSLDGFVVPAEVLEELWVPEFINTVDTVVIRKINNAIVE